MTASELRPTDILRGEIRRLDVTIWLGIAMIAAAVGVAARLGSFAIVLPSFAAPWLVALGLVLGSLFYRYIRYDEPAADALSGASQIIAFASVGAPLSYVAASAAFPLWDHTLAIWDHRLGFDWMGWLAFMNAAPDLHKALAIAYQSFAVQTTVVAMALGIGRHSRHLRVFVLAFMATTLVTIAVSALAPAEGVWGDLHLSLGDCPNIVPITRDTPLAVFFGLRDGTYRQLVATGAEGVISFPSLHAALGLLFMLALWPVRYLRWIALALNLVMIAATPVDGSHYFSDVIAGLGIAAFCWVATSRTVAYLTSVQSPAALAAASAPLHPQPGR